MCFTLASTVTIPLASAHLEKMKHGIGQPCGGGFMAMVSNLFHTRAKLSVLVSVDS